MAIKDVLPQIRKDRGLTQEELAAKLYVTRQAVSRWENGETTPNIDMTKLLANVLQVPVSCLLETPEHFCQSCGMPIFNPSMQGSEADGSLSEDYCSHCYRDGAFTYETDLDSMIEACAPILVRETGVSHDEAVSLMGAMLPNLKRWKSTYDDFHNGGLERFEEAYGEEARALYGDDAVDGANERLKSMSRDEWEAKDLLEESIKAQLRLSMAEGDVRGDTAAELARMHARWIAMHWGGTYNREGHLGLARGYLADQRFRDYYDSACGEGATEFLVRVLEANI